MMYIGITDEMLEYFFLSSLLLSDEKEKAEIDPKWVSKECYAIYKLIKERGEDIFSLTRILRQSRYFESFLRFFVYQGEDLRISRHFLASQIRELRRRSLIRERLRIAKQIQAKIKAEDDISDLLNKLRRNTRGEEETKLLAEAGKNFWRELYNVLFTNISNIDKKLGGLGERYLYVIGGKTSVGKTSLALTLALELAKLRKKILFISLEMGEMSLLKRLVMMETGINCFPPHSLSLTLLEKEEIKRVLGEIKKLPIYCRGTAENLEGEISHLSPDIVFIDYLQLLPLPTASTTSRAIGELMRQFRDLAHRYDIPIVVISQLRRDVGEQASERPTLDKLRESGEIEQTADVVGLIYRKRKKGALCGYEEETNFIIAKNRNGKTGNIKLYFKPDRMRFYSEEIHEVTTN